ncbi:hypothetical protein [Maridesulfovibrio bastinii]|uniref:hypothetical protein n=1 Tax=Maridesulfovibrio bastinii TaxID=47157 RepID=UPI00040D3A95|nr:hypothetical protein [Maridesulfovibrio bastinii]
MTAMKNVVLNRYGKPYKIGDEVIVVNKDKPNFDKIGEVSKLINYNDNPKVSVSFDGDIFNYKPEDIDFC